MLGKIQDNPRPLPRRGSDRLPLTHFRCPLVGFVLPIVFRQYRHFGSPSGIGGRRGRGMKVWTTPENKGPNHTLSCGNLSATQAGHTKRLATMTAAPHSAPWRSSQCRQSSLRAPVLGEEGDEYGGKFFRLKPVLAGIISLPDASRDSLQLVGHSDRKS